MALFLTKPVLWNRNSYTRPSGIKANSGYPKINGFGHEEWNNALQLSFIEDGVEHRAFHTEGVGNASVEQEAGQVSVFMYASHDGIQELVGVAASATCLIGDVAQRRALVKRLKLSRLSEQVWALPSVRALHRDRAAFDTMWREDLEWIPNWRCPADTFLWLDKPAQLDPQDLRGTGKLLTMFNRHTEIDRAEALRMLDFVPGERRTAPWHRIRAEIEAPDGNAIARDLSALRSRKDLAATTRKQLVDARLGQGRFRRDVESLWGGACAVSGSQLTAVLRASHIVAWSRSDDQQRLDGANGLLLTAELDALFDRGLISFDDSGGMLVSAQMPDTDRKLFGLTRPLRSAPSRRQRRYLADHRRHWAF